MKKLVLRLYLAGHSPRSQRALVNIKSLCEEAGLSDHYELEVIDVLEHPQMAEQEKILATPTLVKEVPPPAMRVVGDLEDREMVLTGLELHSFIQLPRKQIC